MQERLKQIIELRKQAEHLAFYRLADELRHKEIELSHKLGIDYVCPCGRKSK
jgi:hypothetical protein